MNIHLRKITAFISAVSITFTALAVKSAGADFELPDLSDTAYADRLSAPAFAEASFSVPEFRRMIDSDSEALVPAVTYTASAESTDLIDTADSLPPSFDMRDEGTISSVKDQGSNGACWSFAAAASAETSLIKAIPYADLSELHSAYFAYYGDDQLDIGECTIEEWLDYGGNRDVIVNLWSQWKGPVSESVLPYENTAVLEDESYTAELENKADFHLENAYMFDYNDDRSNFDSVNELVKQFVYNGNAVDVSFYSNNSTAYNQYEYASFCTEKPEDSNHSVVIAGWDDSFPASAFGEYEGAVPENDGAWLVKNSWGATLGEYGYMWISYEDTSLCEFTVFDMSSNENYSTIYNHDTFVPVQTMSAGESADENAASYMANIFTAEQTQQIEAISTYITNPNTEYEVIVYTDLSDVSDPSSGIASSVTSGVSDMTGYITIELDENVLVQAGEQFAVSVKLYSDESEFVIPIETCMILEDYETGEITELSGYTTYEQICEYTGSDESFYSSDGKAWTDVTAENYVYNDEEKEEIIASLLEALAEDGESQEVIDETEALYRELFASGELMVIMGNISLKAFGNPVGTIDFSHISGAVPSDEQVVLSDKSGGDIYYCINGGDWTEYTEPLIITEKTEISAYTDSGEGEINYTQRIYYPETAEFNAIGYSKKASASVISLEYAERINESYYVINVTEETTYLRLFPVTGADVLMNGTAIENHMPTEQINLTYGSNIITFELSNENSVSNTVTLKINCGGETGDVNGDGIIDPVDATMVLVHYSYASMDGIGTLNDSQKLLADFDGNSIIDVVDATQILIQYSNQSMGLN